MSENSTETESTETASPTENESAGTQATETQSVGVETAGVESTTGQAAAESTPSGTEAGSDHGDAEESDSKDDGSDDSDSGDSDSGDSDSDENGEPRKSRADLLEEEGDIAADYLEELLDIADLDGDIDTYSEGGRAHVSIVTETDKLVGKEGQVLDALQELSRLVVMTETGKRSRLMLDVAGHRDKRRRELTELATDAVEEVKSSKDSVRLAPMNPFERKIVHDVVAAAGLNSESDGEEPRRCVVVMPA